MAKVSWFRALGMAGLLADELTKASVDGRITVDEALGIATKLASVAGLDVDTAGVNLTTAILTDITNAAMDGKITITEIVAFTEKLCLALGIDFDKEGFSV